MQSTLQKFNSCFYSLATQACCAWSWCKSWPKEINDEVVHVKKKGRHTYHPVRYQATWDSCFDLGLISMPLVQVTPTDGLRGVLRLRASNPSPLLGRPPILPIRGKTWLLVFYHLLKIALVLKFFYWNSLLVKHVVNMMRTFVWFFAGLLCVVNGFRPGNFSNK